MDPAQAASFVHPICDFDPFIIPAWKSWLPIHWYGVAYLAGLLIGMAIAMRWVRQQRIPLTRDGLQDFVLWIGIGMVAGGRLGFCIFYDPALFTAFGGGFPWWGVLKIHEGGMASHGGLLGMAIACWWFCHRQRVSVPVLADVVAATAPLGVFFGRLANFWNGELWGRKAEVAWAWHFPNELPKRTLHTLSEVYGTGTSAWQEYIRAHTVPRHPSQLYAAGLEGLCVFAVGMLVHLRHRRPGLTTGAVLCAYGVARFVGEFWREPDAGQPGGPPGPDGAVLPLILGFMSKGQALTLPVFAVGAIVLLWAWRRGARPGAYVRPVPPESPAA